MAAFETLRLRRDYLAANKGRRVVTPGFILLVHPRSDGEPALRAGYTVTKKIGGAVARNRMKRRLRALARDLLPRHGVAGADHILIGRDGGIERDFAKMTAELEAALRKAMSAPNDAMRTTTRHPRENGGPSPQVAGDGPPLSRG